MTTRRPAHTMGYWIWYASMPHEEPWMPHHVSHRLAECLHSPEYPMYAGEQGRFRYYRTEEEAAAALAGAVDRANLRTPTE